MIVLTVLFTFELGFDIFTDLAVFIVKTKQFFQLKANYCAQFYSVLFTSKARPLSFIPEY